MENKKCPNCGSEFIAKWKVYKEDYDAFLRGEVVTVPMFDETGDNILIFDQCEDCKEVLK